MLLGAVCILMAFFVSKYCILCCGLNGKDQSKGFCPIFGLCESCCCPVTKPKSETEEQV